MRNGSYRKAGGRKSWVVRHGHAPKRAPNAAEKAIETRVRRRAKAEIQAQLSD